jgi:hypothetical protein
MSKIIYCQNNIYVKDNILGFFETFTASACEIEVRIVIFEDVEVM